MFLYTAHQSIQSGGVLLFVECLACVVRNDDVTFRGRCSEASTITAAHVLYYDNWTCINR